MSEAQTVTLLFAAPFLLLSIFWLIALWVLEWHERRSIRRLRKEIWK